MKDTSFTGDISKAKIIAALVANGKIVLLPLHDGLRYDIAIDNHGQLQRVQCKTGRLKKGAIFFKTYSVAYRDGKIINRRYNGDEIDLVAVYCPETDRVYVLPIQLVANKTTCHLRITNPNNGNAVSPTRWAKDFEI